MTKIFFMFTFAFIGVAQYLEHNIRCKREIAIILR